MSVGDFTRGRGMAFDWMALATVIGFPALAVARRQSMATIAIPDFSLPMPPIEPPAAPVVCVPANVATIDDVSTDTIARLPRAPTIDADEAVRRFVLEMAEFVPGETIAFSELHDLYGTARRSRRTSGWPPVSSKAFAQRLRSLGCERVQIDMRDQGQGRPVCYVIPETMEGVAMAAA